MGTIGHDPTFISGAQFALKQPAGSKEFLERVPEIAHGSGARDGHKWTMWQS
jgi:hypothetical protein